MSKMEDKFQAHYQRLNQEQREAVDQIDGPVLVLAGPGTGKTELLSMRVANILRQTDATPQNILCLTFTEAASANMTDRMAQLFGAEAYKVAVSTFHGFCLNAMNQFSQYFYNGAELKPASELEKAEIISSILRALPYDNPLSGTFQDLPIYLKSTASAISQIKRQAGLTPDKLRSLAQENLEFIDYIEPDLTQAFVQPFGRKKSDMPKNLAAMLPSLQKIARFAHPEYSLAQVIAQDLAEAVELAEQAAKTTPLTIFRNKYVQYKKSRLSDRERSVKLLALAEVYEIYNQTMLERGLFDFDDMIINVAQALADKTDFKASLQEQYQYILIDEFQDANDAQMGLIYALTDYDQPNVMAVGDDDQAIFSFQGANVNNVSKFLQNYQSQNVRKIQLFRNYRSRQPILQLADSVINASEVRIKSKVFDDVKQLLVVPDGSSDCVVSFLSTKNLASEYSFVATDISRQISDGKNDIAIIAREHRDLLAILPYLEAEGINNIVYENRQDALASPPVRQLELLARVVVYIATGRNLEANSVLPELLAHPAFGVSALDLWRLSLAVERGQLWLEQMLKSSGRLKRVASWLIEQSKAAKNLPLEQALDELFEKFHYDYYFSPDALALQPDKYIEYLSDLKAVREVVREQHNTPTPSLAQFVELFDRYRKYGLSISTHRQFGGDSRVHLLSAHKAKGLEFDTVYILNSSNQKWLSHNSGRNQITLPSNFQLSAETDPSEAWRLLFVAITRARQKLYLTHHEQDDSGRIVKPLELDFFDGKLSQVQPRRLNLKQPDPAWNSQLVKPTADLKTLLRERLANYQLNATALNSYTNLEYAGPEMFLLNNLLRFPSAKSASAEFGSAVHETLRQVYQHFLQRSAKMPILEVQKIFTNNLTARRLAKTDLDFYLKKGLDLLPIYLKWAKFSQHQIPEQNLSARLGLVNLTGKLDLLSVDRSTKTITVIDYKTGAPFDKFDSGTKFKTHGYKQQLMFYKLLIENSAAYSGFRVELGRLDFVEPIEGVIKSLELHYSDTEMAEFRHLVEIVWHNIQNLIFPDTSSYERNLRGSLKFEQDLLK